MEDFKGKVHCSKEIAAVVAPHCQQKNGSRRRPPALSSWVGRQTNHTASHKFAKCRPSPARVTRYVCLFLHAVFRAGAVLFGGHHKSPGQKAADKILLAAWQVPLFKHVAGRSQPDLVQAQLNCSTRQALPPVNEPCGKYAAKQHREREAAQAERQHMSHIDTKPG